MLEILFVVEECSCLRIEEAISSDRIKRKMRIPLLSTPSKGNRGGSRLYRKWGGGGGVRGGGDNSLLISKVTGPLVSAEFYGNVSVLCWRFYLL